MASIQIRDMPEDLYEALAERARNQRRSLAQQAVSDLSRIEELGARKHRDLVVERLRGKRSQQRVSDPVRLVRTDRER